MDEFERFRRAFFVGRDPLELEQHVSVLETVAFHAGRYWPLEAALWDLAGKAEGVPTARLLGGKQEGVARVDEALLPPEARAVRARVPRGRLPRAEAANRPQPRPGGVAAVAAVREAVGPISRSWST